MKYNPPRKPYKYPSYKKAKPGRNPCIRHYRNQTFLGFLGWHDYIQFLIGPVSVLASPKKHFEGVGFCTFFYGRSKNHGCKLHKVKLMIRRSILPKVSTPKLTVPPWKWMVGRWSFPFGIQPIFRTFLLLVLGRGNLSGESLFVLHKGPSIVQLLLVNQPQHQKKTY